MKLNYTCIFSPKLFVILSLGMLSLISSLTVRAATSTVGGTVDYAAAGFGPGIRDTWDWQYPNYDSTSSINGQTVNTAGNVFISVGSGGAIYRATNESGSWAKQTSGVTVDLHDVSFGNGRYIAVGDGGTMLRSSDGITWTTVDLTGLAGTAMALTSVDYSGAGFKVSGYNGNVSIVLASASGVTWARDTNFPNYLPRTNAIRYIPTRDAWVTVGDNGSLAVLNSGETAWDVGFLGTTESYQDVHETADGMAFVVGSEGSILRSVDADLAQWQKQFSGTSYSFTGIASGNGVIVALAQSGRFVTSIIGNGEYWEETSSVFPVNFTSLIFADDEFVAGGNNLSTLSSTTGIDWTLRRSATNYTINDGAETSNRLLVVGGNRTVLRTDVAKTIWSRVSISGVPANTSFNGIVADGNSAVLVGSGGVIMYSTDGGATWTQTTNITTLSGDAYTGDLRSIFYDGSTYIAVGDNLSIFYSSNGRAWKQATSGLSNGSFRDVIKVDDRFIAVGDHGTVYISTNGQSWSQVFTGLTSNLYGVASSDDLMIAVGEDGAMIKSTNGTTWSFVASPTEVDLESILYANGRFIATGQCNSTFSSTDGVNWDDTLSRTQNRFVRVRYL
ncbi:MAG: YCF48-related protein, partial [Puniceicoccales bacterium]